MLLILSEISTLSSVFKLILLLVVFFILLYGAHLFTKWYAKSGIVNARSSNISVIEVRPIKREAQNLFYKMVKNEEEYKRGI